MKWMLLAVTAIILFVMAFFGLAMISSEQQQMSTETLNSPEYQQQQQTGNILFLGLSSGPLAILVIAAIAAIMFFFRRSWV